MPDMMDFPKPTRQRINVWGQATPLTNTPWGGSPARDVSSIAETAQGLVGGYEQAYGEAREASETRYADILGALEGYGEQGFADIEERGAGRQAQVGQEAVSRGLAGTSIPGAMRERVERETGAERRRLGEDVTRMRTGVMERRTDEYPNQELLMQLLSQLGSAGPVVSPAQQAVFDALGGANLWGTADETKTPGSQMQSYTAGGVAIPTGR